MNRAKTLNPRLTQRVRYWAQFEANLKIPNKIQPATTVNYIFDLNRHSSNSEPSQLPKGNNTYLSIYTASLKLNHIAKLFKGNQSDKHLQTFQLQNWEIQEGMVVKTFYQSMHPFLKIPLKSISTPTGVYKPTRLITAPTTPANSSEFLITTLTKSTENLRHWKGNIGL